MRWKRPGRTNHAPRNNYRRYLNNQCCCPHHQHYRRKNQHNLYLNDLVKHHVYIYININLLHYHRGC